MSEEYEAFDLVWVWHGDKCVVERRNVRMVSRRNWTRKTAPYITPARSDLAGPNIAPDIVAYASPVCDADGKHPMIEGRAAQREDLKRNRCRIKEPSETLKAKGAPKMAEPKVTDAMIRTAHEVYDAVSNR